MTAPKIQIFAFNPQFSSALTDANNNFGREAIQNSMTLTFDYNHVEFLQLEQSVLSHDLFLNKTGPDFSGKLINLSPHFKINQSTNAILIVNAVLPKILKPLQTIFAATQKSAGLEVLLFDFLSLSQSKGYDVLSVSVLSWKHGD